jgi:hypothetical protein
LTLIEHEQAAHPPQGADGHDRILGLDLGPGRATSSGVTGASTMGEMQPILTGSTASLKSLAVADSWRATRRFVIVGRRHRAMPRWQGSDAEAAGAMRHG